MFFMFLFCGLVGLSSAGSGCNLQLVLVLLLGVVTAAFFGPAYFTKGVGSTSTSSSVHTGFYCAAGKLGSSDACFGVAVLY